MSTFVSVGNGPPFPRMLGLVKRVREQLPAPIVVQCGTTEFSMDGAQVVSFLPLAKFASLMKQARIVICHGGAGSVIEAVRAGKMPLVMARSSSFAEAVDDHQREFLVRMASRRLLTPFDGMEELQEGIRARLTHGILLPLNELRESAVAEMRELLRTFANSR